ncbi:hypothetical protein OCL06_15600 [Alteromonas sp. ASW11-19]|uniref:Uncharacterized protein n=1 Tax=Alteromonas salexigens TaxID=2982530 RepID=A0ABT2VRS2_9ALTE|nr:hypothetical protein [Alteromonas salexigens]MCU7556015.1 hypothetical protein [Alteromonas salexigens]
MTNEKFKNYVYDLGVILKEKALDAKVEKDKSAGAKDTDYNLGYLMAYYEVVSLMQQQANSFEIELSEIGLDDIDPELELH